jgi:hypothetical protein
MDKKCYIERMLEAENLTDELKDLDAKWLLEWGISQLDDLLKDAPDEDTASNKVTALMGIMRKINRLVGTRNSINPEKLGIELTELDTLFEQAFGDGCNFKPNGKTITADRLKKMSSKNILEFMLKSQP